MPGSRSFALISTLVAAQFVVMLDTSVLNVALPSIAATLGLTAVGTAWVLNAYYLAFGGLLLVSGRAADVFGRRRLFLAGATTLVAGSVLGGCATTETILVIARLIQGAGAAMLSPAAMSIILARFAGAERARTMSWWGAASTAGGAAGVTVGGVLTAGFGWQSVMFVTAAAAAAVGVAGWFLLSADAGGTRRRFDALGAALLTATAVAIVYGVLSAASYGPASPGLVLAGAVAVVGGFGVVLVERRAVDPVLPPSALREPRVAGGIVVNMLGGAARIACFVLVALLIQQVLLFDPAAAGLAMLPTSLAGFLVSTLLLPRLLARLGPEWVTILGLALLVLAHVLFAAVDTGSHYAWRVLPALLVAATGVAFSFTPTTLVIADGMAARNAGVSSGLASSTAQIGGAIGIAVFGAVDAMRRAAAIEAGAGALAAAEAGSSGAHLAAAACAALAIVVAAATFPRVRRVFTPGRTAADATDGG
ncbi:MFS transporter [Microbacterium sp. BK668]|uniref:MFS transporter n=1 Tax=Microbacterium sp. BK668 TaxID=2512118 RepID=UPI0010ECA2A7|nr:MFS transporter [Microbacterium sp. BK668]TDN92584.1 EmrB/QacA subfamily drug resistance transporter [Microbacterium sp. BK668]